MGEIAAVSLAVMLVAAGCLGGQGGGTTGAATQVETTTETAAERLPPGVNETGITNASALVAAHRSALLGTGYAYESRVNTTTERGDRTLRTIESENATVARNLSSFRLEIGSVTLFEDRSVRRTDEFWGNETTVLVRQQIGNDTDHASVARDGPFGSRLEGQLTKVDLLTSVLESEHRVERVETRDGGTFTTLVARETAGGETNPSRFDSTVVVDRAGRIRALDLTIESVENATARRVIRYTFELTDIGVDAVPRPEWAAAAGSETTEGSAASRDGAT